MSNPRKIVQMINSLDCGGAEKLAVDLASRLNGGSRASSIICLENSGELAKETEANGVKVLVAGKRDGFDISLPFRLAKMLKDEKADVVHTHNPGPLVYGTLAAKIAGTRCVVNTRHGREARTVSRFIWKMNDAIVTISQDAKERLLKCNHIDPSSIRVVYNGIDVDRYKNIDGMKKKHIVIGTVSRLSWEKDQITMLDAFLTVSKSVNNVKLVFAGDGPSRALLEEYAMKLGISDKVDFLGYRRDVDKVISSLDIFVLSSLTEGISLSLLEAMAAGKPVVVTNVGGSPEVVIDNETGFLVQPKDPTALAGAILRIIKDPGLSKDIGEAGRRMVREKFSLDRMAKEYENIYEECFSNNKSIS